MHIAASRLGHRTAVCPATFGPRATQASKPASKQAGTFPRLPLTRLCLHRQSRRVHLAAAPAAAPPSSAIAAPHGAAVAPAAPAVAAAALHYEVDLVLVVCTVGWRKLAGCWQQAGNSHRNGDQQKHEAMRPCTRPISTARLEPVPCLSSTLPLASCTGDNTHPHRPPRLAPAVRTEPPFFPTPPETRPADPRLSAIGGSRRARMRGCFVMQAHREACGHSAAAGRPTVGIVRT